MRTPTDLPAITLFPAEFEPPALGTREFLSIVFRDKWRIITTFVLCCLLTLAALMILPKKYEAESDILVRMGREFTYEPRFRDTTSQPVTFDKEQVIHSEIAILRGRDLFERVLEEMSVEQLYPDLKAGSPQLPWIEQMKEQAKDVLAWIYPSTSDSSHGKTAWEQALIEMQRSSDFELLKNSNVIHVTFTHENPDLAAEVVNRLVTNYLDKRGSIFHDRDLPVVEEQMAQAKIRLSEMEQKIHQFKREHGIVSYGDEVSLMLQHRNDLTSKMKDVSVRVDELRFKLNFLRDSLSVIKQELSNGEFNQTRAQLTAAQAAKATLVKQMEGVDQQIDKISKQQIELDNLMRERHLLENAYQMHAKQYEESRAQNMLDNKQSASVTVIQKAFAPLESKSKRILIAAAGLAVAMLLALIVAMASEAFRQTFLVPEQVERSLKLPVLASFPAQALPR